MFAPGTTMIRFSPRPSTQIGATPVGCASVALTSAVSIPKDARFASVISPKTSFPTEPTKLTRAPRSAHITAWFAPLPPKPSDEERPTTVSPARGSSST